MNLGKAIVIDRIENEFAITNRVYKTCFPENRQVLRSNGLLQSQLHIALSHGHLTVLMNQLHDLLAEFVIDSS